VSAIPCPVQEAARRDPNAPAIIAPHRTYTYLDYHEYVSGTENNLQKAGLREGDLLAIAMPPGVPYPLLLMALFRLGVAAFPIDTRFPAAYLLERLRSVRCKNMVVPYGASFTTRHGGLFALGPGDLVEDRRTVREPIAIEAERPATIVLTSGSTDQPKAALLSYGNLYHSALRSNANIPVAPGDRWLMSLPLYHVSGLGILLRSVLGGAAVVFTAAGESLRRSIQNQRVTHLSLVATQLHRMLQEEEDIQALRGLKAILLGGGRIPERLIRAASEAGLPIHTSYGLTEMATQVSTTRPGDGLESLLSSGAPLDASSLRLAPDGRIEVRGETLFLGYVEGSDLRRTLSEDGWFATGDIGKLDGAGYLHVTGRIDNMVIAGGENIQPEEIEACLNQLEGIIEAVVVPVEDDQFGATPVALIRSENDAPLEAAALLEQLRGMLPKHKVPRHFLPWPEAKGIVGVKPSRHALAAHAKALLESGPPV